jgi:hypothetical protein
MKKQISPVAKDWRASDELGASLAAFAGLRESFETHARAQTDGTAIIVGTDAYFLVRKAFQPAFSSAVRERGFLRDPNLRRAHQ